MTPLTYILLLTLPQMIYVAALAVGLILIIKWMERKWAYKPLKPHKWQHAHRTGRISEELRKSERHYPDKVQFYTFWLQIERIRQQHIPGAFAEVGVYKGNSAKVIHQMAPEKTLYLFDTFNGFPEEDLQNDPVQDERCSPHCFSDVDLEEAKANVNGNEHVKFFPGRFPDTAQALHDESFAFVHLDVDLYQPTLEGLHFFYERLSPGGVIIIHDFNHNWSGVTKAIQSFADAIPESVIELPDSFGSAMIIKESMQQRSSKSA